MHILPFNARNDHHCNIQLQSERYSFATLSEALLHSCICEAVALYGWNKSASIFHKNHHVMVPCTGSFLGLSLFLFAGSSSALSLSLSPFYFLLLCQLEPSPSYFTISASIICCLIAVKCIWLGRRASVRTDSISSSIPCMLLLCVFSNSPKSGRNIFNILYSHSLT